MQRLPNPKFLFLLIFIGIIAACKKNEPLMGSNGFGLLQKSTNANFSQYVSYDANHNVLVFDSFEDVDALFEAIDEYDNNYPMDKGNTQTILDTFNKIRQYGFTMGNGNGGPNANKVKLQQFQTELLNSYPLSDTVLNGLIDLYDELQPSFPPPFMKTVLEANASFTFEVRENIEQCNLPVGIKNQILAKDDNTTIIPNYAYDDFLNSINGFQSIYTVLENTRKNQLENGMDPSNPLYDKDIVNDEQLRLILNTQREVYIKGNLIKLYDSCKYAIFQGSISQAYADLARLDANGFVTTPTGIVEPTSGISLSTMNTYFPMNYASVNPTYLELKENPREGAFIELEAIDSYLSFCPQSVFTIVRDNTNSFGVTFDSYTDITNAGSSGNYYQYWTFGDGTGSFQTDPFHIYSAPGLYEVTLTTFNQECGCWDVQKRDIGIGLSAKACYGYIGVPYATSNAGEWNFTFTGSEDLSNAISSITIDYDDGSSLVTTTGPFDFGTSISLTHTFQESGTYNVTATFVFGLNICTDIVSTPVTVTGVNNPCCQKEDSYSGNVVTSFGNGDFRLIIDDFCRGQIGFFGTGTKIRGKQELQRLVAGKWRERKGDHRITISGAVNNRDKDICGATDLEDEDKSEFKSNKNSLSLVKNYNRIFGLPLKNQVLIKHEVKHGNGVWSEHEIFFGDCE